MKKEKENNSNNINIKKKSLIISLVLVSFISIILLIPTLLSFTSDNNNGISSVNAQEREPPPISPSQLQAEEQQQQQQQQLQEQQDQLLSSPTKSASPSCAEKQTDCQQRANDLLEYTTERCEFLGTMNPRFPETDCIANALFINALSMKRCQDQFFKCQDTGCPAGYIPCGTECVNLQTDISNCGACGNACSNIGESCVGGTCQCPAGLSACNGQCIDTSSNNANCGSCGNACTGGQSCQAGSCQCPPDKPNLVNGQCQQCPAGQVPGTGADEGKCVPDCSALGPGYQWCTSSNRCVNTNIENGHCGVCGNNCFITKPGTICQNGVCSGTVPKCLSNPGSPTGCSTCLGETILCASCISIVQSCS